MLAGWRATSQTERWWTLIVEGATNLAVAATVLVWAALAVVPLISLASGWAIVTGPLAPGLFRRGVGRLARARHRPGAVRGWRSEDDGAVADRLCAGVWRHAPGAHLPPEAAPPEAGGSAHPA
jgi:hypothetical protein